MTNFYRLMGTLLIVGSIWLLPLDPAFAQLTLVSSTPADGAVSVASPATFQLTFSSALDTTARFEEPDDFFWPSNFSRKIRRNMSSILA